MLEKGVASLPSYGTVRDFYTDEQPSRRNSKHLNLGNSAQVGGSGLKRHGGSSDVFLHAFKCLYIEIPSSSALRMTLSSLITLSCC